MPVASELGVASVQDVVERMYGIVGTARGDEYDMLCPHPNHIDTNPSAAVNLSSGLWKCLACGAAGDLASLGALTLHKPREQVLEMLRPTTPQALAANIRVSVSRAMATLAVRRKRVVIPDPSRYRDGPLDVMRERRGITEATMRRFGVRYVVQETLHGHKRDFTITHSLAVPVTDGEGHLKAWCYVRTPNSASWQPKSIYTPGVDVSPYWFGLEQAPMTGPITVVEGALDAMWVSQCGHPAAALLGAHMINAKLFQLQRHSRAYLLGDRDTAGVISVKKAGELLGPVMATRVCLYRPWMRCKRPNEDGTYSPASDPEELLPADVELIHALARPWLEWSFRASPTGSFAS